LERDARNRVGLPACKASEPATVFANSDGANQAVRLPQEMRFPTDVKEVRFMPSWLVMTC
jgi:hypothetical protein